MPPHTGEFPRSQAGEHKVYTSAEVLLLVPVNHIIRAGIPYGVNIYCRGNTHEDIGNKAGEVYQRIYLQVKEAEKQKGIGKTRGLKIVIIF